MLKLKNREVGPFTSREPFAFKSETAPTGRTDVDYCEMLSRPGYHDEDIYKEGLSNTLWGRTFFLENTNRPGISVCYHVPDICPNFAMEAEYETGLLPQHLRKKLAKNRAFRKFVLQPIQLRVIENHREIEFTETRRDYYWELRPEKDGSIGGYVRSTSEPVAYDNCCPDRHTSYFHSQDGIELAQTISVHEEVILLSIKLMNVSNAHKDVSLRISDRKGMGFEGILGAAPPSVANDSSGNRLVSKYVEWPLTGLTFILVGYPEAAWRATGGDGQESFFSACCAPAGSGPTN
jgi:hypothetical protein